MSDDKATGRAGSTRGPHATAGEPVVGTDVCALSSVRRVAAMLDYDPSRFADGGSLPRGWHFFLLGGDTRRSELRADGFPGFGVAMPELGLPRLLLGGRTVEYRDDLTIGTQVRRVSRIASITRKPSGTGEMAVVTIRHELGAPSGRAPAIVEEQTYILGATDAFNPAARPPAPLDGVHSKVLVPDETLLFQYSALGFNSHKIHIDRTYVREVEGLPDLVINGGLATLLLTEMMRTELGLAYDRISTRHTAALYCRRPMTLTAAEAGDAWRLRVHDDRGAIAVEMEAKIR